MVNEAARILDEGVAQRASDIDVIWRTGFGWPAARGGPMYWADSVGPARILGALRRWTEEGRPGLEPARGLVEAANRPEGFGTRSAALAPV
jgi:3-hydroxyacyl-CoA dehydrogenase